MESILTHNGKVTVVNPASGDHRTFRVKTQPVDSGFAPGKRVLSLLVGPDNQNDYKGFGFVDGESVILWRSKRTGDFPKFANILQNPQKFEGRLEYKFETRCRVCNRPLTNPASIESGIGPTCAENE